LVINDELHRFMRNRDTQSFTYQKSMHIERFIGLSATWASRGPQDLWPVLHILDRKIFPSYWDFVQTWCYVEEGTFGKEIFGVRNVENLKKMLWGAYYRGRTWKEVGHLFGRQGEPTIRRAEKVPMTKKQAKAIATLRRDMILEMHGKMVVTPN